MDYSAAKLSDTSIYFSARSTFLIIAVESSHLQE